MPLNKKSIPCGGLVGKTFGRLTVEKEYRSGPKYILCECEKTIMVNLCTD